jgi:hypothetical protein
MLKQFTPHFSDLNGLSPSNPAYLANLATQTGFSSDRFSPADICRVGVDLPQIASRA